MINKMQEISFSSFEDRMISQHNYLEVNSPLFKELSSDFKFKQL